MGPNAEPAARSPAQPPAQPAAGPVVGFDLDMTLVDSRPGLEATLADLARETGEDRLARPGTVDALLGSTVDAEFRRWFGEARGAPLADRFRVRYAEIGIAGTDPLPGAHRAVARLRATGVRVIVVTAKFEPNAHRCLDHVGLEVDAVFGFRHGPAKAEVLRSERATAYVGDTPADMAAARTAGAIAVGVATGPHSGDELGAAGADVVLSGLADLVEWWTALRSSR